MKQKQYLYQKTKNILQEGKLNGKEAEKIFSNNKRVFCVLRHFFVGEKIVYEK